MPKVLMGRSWPRRALQRGWHNLLLGVCLAAPLLPASAWELAGTKSVVLHTRDGLQIAIGTVAFVPAAEGRTAFSVSMDSAVFKDYFLSMREFKCLDGQGEVFCHVPYPYRQPGTVSATDFAWLEHALLFLFKLPHEFGAKLWNGVIFRLQAGERGLVGTPQAVDLNLIGVAPPPAAEAPFRPALRDDIASGTRWIVRLSIE